MSHWGPGKARWPAGAPCAHCATPSGTCERCTKKGGGRAAPMHCENSAQMRRRVRLCCSISHARVHSVRCWTSSRGFTQTTYARALLSSQSVLKLSPCHVLYFNRQNYFYLPAKEKKGFPFASFTENKMKEKLEPTTPTFLDHWRRPPRCVADQPNELDANSVKEVKKWRLQILLAINPYGIPSLAFAEAYQRMYNTKLDVQELGFEHLSEMVSKMSHVFAVQEPDETTRILFPQYADDKILHDARLGHNFSRPNLDCVGYENLGHKNWSLNDSVNDLIHRAWLNRDEDFPSDVVLAGETYDMMLPMTLANIPGTRGVYQGVIVGAASPSTFYIRLKTNNSDDYRGLPLEIEAYFENKKDSIEAYTVPKEFLYPGFPVLSYGGKDKLWERAIVVGGSSDGKKILIESVDFGGVYAANPRGLYLMPRKFFDIPRQSYNVSLAGLKPVDAAEVRPEKVGSRIRCFSFDNYWLELILLELPKNDDESKSPSPIFGLAETSNGSSIISGDSGLSKESPMDPPEKPKTGSSTKSRLVLRPPTFETIIVDRHDEDIDIFVDEILALETYAVFDENRLAQIQELKKELKKALVSIPRPECPT